MRVLKSWLSITKLLSPVLLSTWLVYQWDHRILENTLRHIEDISFSDHEVISPNNLSDTLHRPMALPTNGQHPSIMMDISQSNIDLVIPEKTRSMVLSSTARNMSKQSLLFHVIHTSSEDTFGTMQKRCIESIYYHHPLATVMLHVKNMTDGPVKYLIEAGYDLQLVKYDIVEKLELLKGEDIVDAETLQNFTSKIDDYANDPKGFWYANESDLLRMIVMYFYGGIYLDTDTIVVKQMDVIPPNTIGFEDRNKKQMNGAVLILEKKNEFTRACLKEFLTNFNNRIWAANGPLLITRIYFSDPKQWNMKTFGYPRFEYFGWRRIGEDCYKETKPETVYFHLRQIRKKAYVVHMNNNLGHVITEGSACECLRNTFCLSSTCRPLDRCIPLVRRTSLNLSSFELPTQSHIDVIEPENTQSMILGSSPRKTSKRKLLFHVIHTSSEYSFGAMQKRCIESIFYHHPLATVMFHVKTMTDGPVRYLIEAGYDLQLVKYDIVEKLKQLEGEEIVEADLLRNFVSKINEYARDRKGYWYANESDLLRMIVMYIHGGIYLDTDTVVVNQMDVLSPNTIGFEDPGKKQMNGAVLLLERKHEFSGACLKEFLTNFDNRRWAANGPVLITRVYRSNPDLWNITIVPASHFEYFGWQRIGKNCYQDSREEMVLYHLRQIHQKAYVVHMNNKLGHVITEGSPCECLRNTFCLSNVCKLLDRCIPLFGELPVSFKSSSLLPSNTPVPNVIVTMNEKNTTMS